MSIYTSEQETKSYSGVGVQEFIRHNVRFRVSKGMSGKVKAYNVRVLYYNEQLFNIYTYEGDKLYDVLEKRVEAEIAAKVF
jgi:hypothetical protein